MNNTNTNLLERRHSEDSHALVQQLEREITCLSRQLDRLKLLDGTLDSRTESTYQDMINSRIEILNELI